MHNTYYYATEDFRLRCLLYESYNCPYRRRVCLQSLRLQCLCWIARGGGGHKGWDIKNMQSLSCDYQITNDKARYLVNSILTAFQLSTHGTLHAFFLSSNRLTCPHAQF
jgi:hypothetical protein